MRAVGVLAGGSLAYDDEIRTVLDLKIPNGIGGKVRAMRKIIDHYAHNPLVREYAVETWRRRGATERDDWGQAEAILEEVQSWDYVPEKGEQIQSPLYTIKHKFGDCDDLALAFCALLESILIPTKLEILGTRLTPDLIRWEHIYPLVGLPAKRPAQWFAAETTLPFPLGKEPKEYKLAQVSRGASTAF
jgi:transglutaminase-like putative cysteine protease